jgi:hypothetical protein
MILLLAFGARFVERFGAARSDVSRVEQIADCGRKAFGLHPGMAAT